MNASAKPLHIDIPVKMTDVKIKMVFSIGAPSRCDATVPGAFAGAHRAFSHARPSPGSPEHRPLLSSASASTGKPA